MVAAAWVCPAKRRPPAPDGPATPLTNAPFPRRDPCKHPVRPRARRRQLAKLNSRKPGNSGKPGCDCEKGGGATNAVRPQIKLVQPPVRMFVSQCLEVSAPGGQSASVHWTLTPSRPLVAAPGASYFLSHTFGNRSPRGRTHPPRVTQLIVGDPGRP